MASYSVQYIFTLVDRFSAGAPKMQAAAQGIQKAVAAAGAAMSKFGRLASVASVAIGAAAALAISHSVEAAAAFEDKMAEVRKVVPNMTKDMMWELGDSVLALSAKTAVSAENVADIFAAGARMGIRGNDALSEFADTVVKVSAAWDGVSASLAGESLATISGKFFGDLPQVEAQKRMRGVADSINYLAQNTAGVKNVELLKFFQNAGSAFANPDLKMTAEEAAAYGATAMKTGQPSGFNEGTRANSTMNRLVLAASAALTTKKGLTKAGQAFQALGMTQDAYAGMLRSGATDALLGIMERVKDLDVVDSTRLLTNLLGDARAARQVANMSGQLNEFKKSLAMVSDKYAERFSNEKEFMDWMRVAYPQQAELLEKTGKALHYGSVDQEFNARMDTVRKQAERVTNAFTGLQIQLGKPFLPYVEKFYKTLADAISGGDDESGLGGLNKWLSQNQSLIESVGIGSMAAGLVGAANMAMSLGVYLTGAASKGAMLWSVLSRIGRLTGWAILITGLVELVANLDKVKASATDALNVIKQLFNNGTADTGKGSSYYNLNKALENTALGRLAISSGLATPIDDIIDARNDANAISSSSLGIVSETAARAAVAAAESASRSYSPFQQMQTYTPPDETWFSRLNSSYDRVWQSGSMLYPGNPQFNNAQIPQSLAINSRVEAHTSFDPATINVTVTGSVNGPVSGSGSGTVNARPSRGEATSEAGASAPQGGFYGP